jgi:lipoprotein-releasing system ATP-binding protein
MIPSVHESNLALSGVSKQYPTPRGPLTVLSDISLSLRVGDAVAITGPSGSGKSTLLYIAGALEPPTRGEVRLDGIDPYRIAERDAAAFRNEKIGFVFQDYRKRAGELLDQVGLADRMDHLPAELSGGEKQRVSLARALIRRPRLLLCDEPTGNLDEASAEMVAGLLLDLHARKETMLIVVTHSSALAARFPRRYELRHANLQPAGA